MPEKSRPQPEGDPTEYRRYRQALYAVYLAVGLFGAVVIIGSIVVELFFHRGRRAPAPTPPDLIECNRSVRDLLLSLGETAAALQLDAVKGESTDQLSTRWDQFTKEWQTEWESVNGRCRFDELDATGIGFAFDRMARVHRQLPMLRLRYAEMMKRFEEEQASTIADMRRALDKSLVDLEKQSSRP